MNKVKLKEICRLINGRAYKQHELLDSGKYPVLRVGNFFSDKGFYYSDMELEADKYCDDGDLLFAWSASFGPKIWNGGKVIYHYHIWKMELTEKVDKYYLYYYLYHLSERIKSEGHGGIMIHTTKAEMEEREFVLPDLSKQKEIAKVLAKSASAIELRKQELEKLDELIKARFVEMFGKCTCYEKLENADVIISDGNYSSKYPTADEFVAEGVPFIRASNMVDNTITDEEMYYITDEKHAELLKGHVKPYDVLIATRGAGIGKIAVVPEHHDDSNINAQIVLLRCNKEIYNPLYLSWYMKLQSTQMKIKGLVSGSAQPQLPIKRLIQLELLKPEVDKQNEFAEFVHQVDKSKVAEPIKNKRKEESYDKF